MNPRALASLVLVASLVLPRATLAAWSHDPAVGLGLGLGPNPQVTPVATSDGAGGMIVAWVEETPGGGDIYAQRVSKSGDLLWTAGSTPVCTAAQTQFEPAIVADGAGGAIVAWVDQRSGSNEIYAQRLDPSGTPQWTANGVALTASGTASRDHLVLAPSGTDGAIAAWIDLRSGSPGIYARRIDLSGTPRWTSNGVALTTGLATYSNPSLVIDGKGGAILLCQRSPISGSMISAIAQRVAANGTVRWGSGVFHTETGLNAPRACEDGNSGVFFSWEVPGTNTDLWGQRIDSTGAIKWGAAGLAINAEASVQQDASLRPDGADGLYAVWRDSRGGFYGQRLNGSGTRLWNPAGVLLASASGSATTGQLLGDGASGGRFAWADLDPGNLDILAQRFDGSGAPLWGATKDTVSSAAQDQSNAAIVADGLDGTMVAWQDARTGMSHIYAARLDRYGVLGDVAATITAVYDVPNDQGGLVHLGFQPSPLDVPGDERLVDYRVLRQDGPNLYTVVATAPATAGGGYILNAPTLADSTAAGQAVVAFVVRARFAADTTETWDSAPANGYSVDNLAPAKPAAFTGQYAAGTAHLHWARNTEPDLAGYRLYRGNDTAFTPGPANLLASPPDTGYTDVAGGSYVYKLTAVDVHGNESAANVLAPGGVAAAGGAPPGLAFAPPAPDPAAGGAVTLRFTLPRAMRAGVALFAADGRRVRALVPTSFAAGDHALTLGLVDARGGRLAAGVYVVRLETEAGSLTRRLAVVP